MMRSLLPFSRKLFWSVMTLFLTYAACFIAYQYQREKEFKTGLLDARLQDYNHRLYEYLSGETDDLHSPGFAQKADDYLARHPLGDLRVTLIAADGWVVFDSEKRDLRTMDNHLKRREVQQALQQGCGHDVNRLSGNTGTSYFYSAQYFPDRGLIVRSALPYDIGLRDSLRADRHFVWFALAITLVLTAIFYTLTRKLGAALAGLKQFALQADRGEPIDTHTPPFAHDELGEISEHIVRIYRRLLRTKEALVIEREKLITHLQTSHEGLGIFDAGRNEILTNPLFAQYANLLSDCNLTSTEEVFAIPELEPIRSFIDAQGTEGTPAGERRKALTIDKGGRIFHVECVIFQDGSFELSLNDITQEEQQIRLKRQLTQNIAHELKTPVSSIQGYLETLAEHPDLPADKRDEFLNRCHAQSTRLASLLRDISVLTRMDEAPGLIEMETVDIAATMRRIEAEVALQTEEKRIRVENLLPPTLEVPGNPSLLYSIFRNLMDNAIAYAGTDITVSVKCFRTDSRFCYFSFADTGTGVAPEHLKRLFERFYRVDKGRSRKLGGTGLGLAIVKNAVLLHGGHIVAKANPGGGLEFIFTLRRNAQPAETNP